MLIKNYIEYLGSTSVCLYTSNDFDFIISHEIKENEKISIDLQEKLQTHDETLSTK